MEIKSKAYIFASVVFFFVFLPYCSAGTIWKLINFQIDLGLEFKICDLTTLDLIDDVRKVTHILKPGVEIMIDENYDFQMFCRKGEPKNIFYYFRTATVSCFYPSC